MRKQNRTKQIYRNGGSMRTKRSSTFLMTLWFQFEYILAIFLLFLVLDVARSLLFATTIKNVTRIFDPTIRLLILEVDLISLYLVPNLAKDSNWVTRNCKFSQSELCKMLTKSYTGLCSLNFLIHRLILNGNTGKISPLQNYPLPSHSIIKTSRLCPCIHHLF